MPSSRAREDHPHGREVVCRLPGGRKRNGGLFIASRRAYRQCKDSCNGARLCRVSDARFTPNRTPVRAKRQQPKVVLPVLRLPVQAPLQTQRVLSPAVCATPLPQSLPPRSLLVLCRRVVAVSWRKSLESQSSRNRSHDYYLVRPDSGGACAIEQHMNQYNVACSVHSLCWFRSKTFAAPGRPRPPNCPVKAKATLTRWSTTDVELLEIFFCARSSASAGDIIAIRDHRVYTVIVLR